MSGCFFKKEPIPFFLLSFELQSAILINSPRALTPFIEGPLPQKDGNLTVVESTAHFCRIVRCALDTSGCSRHVWLLSSPRQGLIFCFNLISTPAKTDISLRLTIETDGKASVVRIAVQMLEVAVKCCRSLALSLEQLAWLDEQGLWNVLTFEHGDGAVS